MAPVCLSLISPTGKFTDVVAVSVDESARIAG
jgi:hypothetical protein